MRAFVQLRRMIASHEELARKLTELEAHLSEHDEQIQAIFERTQSRRAREAPRCGGTDGLQAIRQLMAPPDRPPRKIGFRVEERGAVYRRKNLANPSLSKLHAPQNHTAGDFLRNHQP